MSKDLLSQCQSFFIAEDFGVFDKASQQRGTTQHHLPSHFHHATSGQAVGHYSSPGARGGPGRRVVP